MKSRGSRPPAAEAPEQDTEGRVAGASIRVVSNRTGLSPDTLRVWERRYGFPKPSRREGGVRVYAPEDIARLELIARAIAAGWRPHEVVALPPEELRKIAPAGPSSLETTVRSIDAPNIDAIVAALARDDLVFVRSQLRAAAVVLGPKAFVMEVARPLAMRIGDEWHSGTLEVRHEHALTAVLTMQLHVLLAAHEDPGAGPLVVLATLPGERHALALDMVAVYLAASHAAPRLLGPDLPPEQIVAAGLALGPAAVGISVSSASDPAATLRALGVVAKGLRPSKTELWLGGAGAVDLDPPDGVRRVGDAWSDIDAALASLRR